MKYGGQFITGFALALLISSSAQAGDLALSGNPYSPIVARNIFALIPMPTNPPDLNLAAPPPKITPNGIMSVFGRYQVLFKVAVPPSPGQPATDASYMMGEGERQDDIEVVRINYNDAIITFNNHGTIQELPLETAKNINTPVPGGAPAGINPGVTTRRSRNGMPMPGGDPAGRRPGLGRNLNAISQGNGNRAATSVASSSGFATVSGGTSNASDAKPQAELSPEEQITLQEIQMEKQRAQWLDENNPSAAVVPPTSLTQAVLGQDNGSSDTTPANSNP